MGRSVTKTIRWIGDRHLYRTETGPLDLCLKQIRDFGAPPSQYKFSCEISPSVPAFGEDRTRFDSVQAFMSYIGIAPVKEESGKKRWVHWRWSCPIFLRQTFVEWVDQARRHSAWSQAFYKQQRASGKSHPKAIRALAYKWGRILWRCWQDGTAYDEEQYLAALKRKKSTLIALLDD